jgi:hypothetical protein
MSRYSIHFDELWALGVYYFLSLSICLIATSIGFFLLRRPRQTEEAGRVTRRLVGYVLVMSPVIWLIYCGNTLRDAFAITSLDSEDDQVAEAVYETAFNVDLDHAVRIAINKSQPGNVRFYASCRIADLLDKENDRVKAAVLDEVATASEFRTGFFGTNQLTCGFFIPNYAEGPFTVSGIIRRRLKILSAQ